MSNENAHIPGPSGATSAVFVTPEDRERGLDPVAVAAELARKAAAPPVQVGGRGVSVQMLQGPVPGAVAVLPAGAPPQPGATPAAAAIAPPAMTPLLQAPPGGVQSWGAPGVVAVARSYAQPPAPPPVADALPVELAAAGGRTDPDFVRVSAPNVAQVALLFGLPLEADGSILLPRPLAARVALAFPGMFGALGPGPVDGMPPAPEPPQPVPPEATAAGVELEGQSAPALLRDGAPSVDDTRGTFGAPAGPPLLIEIRGPVTIVSPGRLRVLHAEDPDQGSSEVTIEPATDEEG